LSFGNEDGIFRCSRHSAAVTSAGGASSCNARNDNRIPGKDTNRAVKGKQQQLESADWKSPSNFIVKDNVLKQMLGMDASLFNVDMLKLGFISRKFNKAVCHETIINTVLDGKVYDSIDPASSSTATDSTSLKC
jgi:hypothetical protein